MTPPVQKPLISVIIPTYRRPEAVCEAAASALAQTWQEVEVIVVSDGPDEVTKRAIAALSPKVRYLELSTNQGPAAARNAGVQASQGTWLSFLDDDDSMLPERLERQMQLADAAQPLKMISCRIWYRHGMRTDVWPARPIDSNEDLGDYLLVRPSLRQRPGVISIQSLLMHRSLLEWLPFTSHPDHEDWSWLLDAWHYLGARVLFVWEPLVTYNIDVSTTSRSRRLHWQESLRWAFGQSHHLSDRAFCSFVATKVALKAKRAGAWKALWTLAREMQRRHASVQDWVSLAGITALPTPLLQGAWRKSLQSSPRKSHSTAEIAASEQVSLTPPLDKRCC